MQLTIGKYTFVFLVVNLISPGSLEKPDMFAMRTKNPTAEIITPTKIRNFPKFCTSDSRILYVHKNR
jgi:hypothetical protein